MAGSKASPKAAFDRVSLAAAAVAAAVSLLVCWLLGKDSYRLIVFGLLLALAANIGLAAVWFIRVRRVGRMPSNLDELLPEPLSRLGALLVAIKFGIVAASMYLLLALILLAIFGGPAVLAFWAWALVGVVSMLASSVIGFALNIRLIVHRHDINI
jgi:hypothetical protein